MLGAELLEDLTRDGVVDTLDALSRSVETDFVVLEVLDVVRGRLAFVCVRSAGTFVTRSGFGEDTFGLLSCFRTSCVLVERRSPDAR